MKQRVGVVGCVAMLGCSSTPGTGTAIGVEATASAAPRAPVARSAAPYEVHEWGLVRAEVGDVLNTGAIAPPSNEPLIMDKPVLYFHASQPMKLRRVGVRTPNGSILETWPPASGGDASIEWTDVALAPSGACDVSPLPRPGTGPCVGLPAGLDCEAPQLSIVRTEDADCVTSGSMTERFLFYRARTEVFTPPLAFSRAEDQRTVTITNAGMFVPGMLVRIRNHDGVVHSTVVLPPEPGKQIVVGLDAVEADDRPTDRRAAPAAGAGPDAVKMTLSELGMTPAEVKAFMDAWSETIFMPNGFNGLDAPSDAFLYFLPPQAVDAIARLDLDPPPRAVKRAFAVWTAVDAFKPQRY